MDLMMTAWQLTTEIMVADIAFGTSNGENYKATLIYFLGSMLLLESTMIEYEN